MCANKHVAQCQVLAKPSTKHELSRFIYGSVCSAFKGQYGLLRLDITWKFLLTKSA